MKASILLAGPSSFSFSSSFSSSPFAEPAWYIAHAVICSDDDVVSPTGECLARETVQREYGKWIPPKGLLETYHGFWSYRWTTRSAVGDDSAMMEAMFQCLLGRTVEERQVEVFLDVHRLRKGRNFRVDFMEALFASSGAMLMVSEDALQRMISSGDCNNDNVLLGWALIWHLGKMKHLSFVLPLLCGAWPKAARATTGPARFDRTILEKLPNTGECFS